MDKKYYYSRRLAHKFNEFEEEQRRDRELLAQESQFSASNNAILHAKFVKHTNYIHGKITRDQLIGISYYSKNQNSDANHNSDSKNGGAKALNTAENEQNISTGNLIKRFFLVTIYFD